MSTSDPSHTSAGYDLWSSAYDSLDSPMLAMVDIAWQFHPWNVASQRILELGCGTGRNIPRLLEQGPSSYIGIDASSGMLAHARQRLADPRVALLASDITTFPPALAPAAFDRILITLVLEHLESLQPVFATIRQAIAPAGTVRIIEMHPELYCRGAQAHFWHAGQEIRLPSFRHGAAEIRQAASTAGLQITSMTDWFATASAVQRCAKLRKHLGLPVLLEVRAALPAV